MQADPNSHPDSEKITEVKQPRSSKHFFVGDSGRRSFLKGAGLFTTAGVVAGVVGTPFASKKGGDLVQAQDVVGKFDYTKFREKAYQVRVAAAKANRDIPIPPHPTNGDEAKYANKIATDTRGLPHNQLAKWI